MNSKSQASKIKNVCVEGPGDQAAAQTEEREREVVEREEKE